MNWQNNPITAVLKERILILDGAMGTMIQRHSPSFPEGAEGDNDLLVLTQPQLIESIHRQYVEAGADIITTNTFNANRISQADYGMQEKVYEMNKAAVALARSAGAHFVAGSMGPTNKSASLSPDVNDPGSRAVSFSLLVDAYSRQVCGLRDGGVDVFLIETAFDTLNTKAALFAIEQQAPNIPIMVSATVADAGGRILSGQTLEAFLISVSHAPLLSIGLNCSFGADKMLPFIRTFSKKAPFFVSAHPNAGLPDLFGNYTQTPEMMARTVMPYIQEGLVNVLGGCCGTTPDHIACIARVVRQLAGVPRQVPKPETMATFSGCEPLVIQKEIPFLNVGERTNVAGSRKFARLIREEQYDQALDIARTMVEDGAHIIDVNMDDPLLDAPSAMRTFLLRMASEPEIARVPVMVDSSSWEVIETALQCLQGKSIVNSISLKEGEEEFLRKAARVLSYGAAVVVMAFDEQGQATDYARKTAICERAYHLLTERLHFPANRIIFDPNVLTVATGMEQDRRYAIDFIQTVRFIKTNLPGALVSGGISNLSFAFRGNDAVREAMHSVFLYHCIQQGMDMAIIKPGAQPIYDDIPLPLRKAVEAVILDTDTEATQRLVELVSEMGNEASVMKHEERAQLWRSLPAAERLTYSLVHGIDAYLSQDLEQVEARSALALVEGPLMEGMNRVGELFSQGKMFLPQVVKTARVMKHAVQLLQPRLEKEKAVLIQQGRSSDEPCGIIATVKGDVHDIGKNLVTVVMECNHYKMIDLGVMIPADVIVQAVKSYGAQFVCLSGLITPSLSEMIEVAQALNRAGLDIPLLIGGATTSAEFTALRLAPQYKGPAIYCSDASRNVVVLSQLFGNHGTLRDAFEQQMRREQQEIRNAYEQKQLRKKYVTLEQARRNRFFSPVDSWKPPFYGVQTIEMTYAHLEPLISWKAFLKTWEMHPHQAPSGSNQAESLLADARLLLHQIKEQEAVVKAVVGFFHSKTTAQDEILLFESASAQEPALVLPMPRDLKEAQGGSSNLCLSDFVGNAMGLFTLTAGEVPVCESEDLYQKLLWQSLLDVLAEAASVYLHRHLLGGLGIAPAFGYPCCPDHRLKEGVVRLLGAEEKLGIHLTLSFMIQPVSSICGMYIPSAKARYFSVIQ